MARFFLRLGKLLVINRKHRSIRTTVILLFTNLLVLAGIIFSLEIILILFGISDIILPIPFSSAKFLLTLIF